MLHTVLSANPTLRDVPDARHQLYLDLPTEDEPARIETYFPDVLDQVDPNKVRPVVVILPGGAYQRISAREAEPIAIQMVARGFAACVVTYSCAPATYPTSLVQVAGVVAFLRSHSAEFHIDPNKIILCGFSAGGHLACDLGCEWQEEWLAKRVGVQTAAIKPNGLILGYPVISSGKFAHRQSIDNLTGGNDELAQKLSLENRVSSSVPPTFIFHTLQDPEVPVENSLLLANSLRKAGISFSLHIFPYGPHGLSLANEDTARIGRNGQVQPLMQCWPDLAADWIKSL